MSSQEKYELYVLNNKIALLFQGLGLVHIHVFVCVCKKRWQEVDES